MRDLKPLEIDLILPSHGLPFSGHRAWIEQTVQHHSKRCAEIRCLLEGGPRTAYSLAGDLWQKQLLPAYKKIKPNVNLTLIFTNQNGWQVMLYDKNVFNTTAITGDFLNSDDSGLTTNVFLTDPKLIGIRVTKNW